MRALKTIHGFHLLEMIVALSILCSLLTLGSRYISKNVENSVNKIVASHLKQVTKSAQHYVQDNFENIKNNEELPLDFPILVEKGYLSENFPKKNHYGQAYQFKVSKNKAGLQILLTTIGGNPITEASLRQIANLAGSAAGYASVLHQGKIVGTHQGWMLEGFPLKTGHLASLTMVNEQEVMDAATFLRKTKFIGHPEYNEMQTDLSMLANNIYLMEGDFTGNLSKDRLLLSNKEGKQIDIYNDSKPYIKIEDSNRTWSTVIEPAEIQLESQVSENKSYVGNDRFSLENRNWSTVIKPAEVRLESQDSGRKSYVGNDHINFTLNHDFSELSPSKLMLNNDGNKIDITNKNIKFYTNRPKYYSINGIWVDGNKTNEEISISADSLHVPYYYTNYGQGWSEFGKLVTGLCYQEGNSDRIGRLFFVNSTNYNKAYLILCGHDGTIYINKGFSQY